MPTDLFCSYLSALREWTFAYGVTERDKANKKLMEIEKEVYKYLT